MYSHCLFFFFFFVFFFYLQLGPTGTWFLISWQGRTRAMMSSSMPRCLRLRGANYNRGSGRLSIGRQDLTAATTPVLTRPSRKSALNITHDIIIIGGGTFARGTKRVVRLFASFSLLPFLKLENRPRPGVSVDSQAGEHRCVNRIWHFGERKQRARCRWVREGCGLPS